MKKLCEVVNVVPIIAKSDALTLDERAIFKERVGRSHLRSIRVLTGSVQIRAEMEHHSIRAYPFDAEDADPEEVQLNEAIRVKRGFLQPVHR